MATIPFSALDVKTLIVKKPRANETSGKSAWIDGEHTLFSSKDSKLLWPIRPGSTDGTVKPYERLNLEIGCSQAEEQIAKECDELFLDTLLKMKVDFFGASKAKSISNIDSLRPIYKNLLREGAEGKDGIKYANSLRMKVDGWAKYISNVNVVEKVKADGEKLKVVKDCDWKNRLVDDGDAPSDRDTHFLLFLGNNPETGKPRYSDKVVVTDEFGKPVVKSVSPDGKVSYVMRYVGPQDAAFGATLTVVWQLSKLYLTETTGPTSVAKDVYIKPAQKKNVGHAAMPDLEIESNVDASEMLLAIQNVRSAASTSGGGEDDESRKRHADDNEEEGGGSPSRKSRKIVVSEDF